jgi:hypothetical protein
LLPEGSNFDPRRPRITERLSAEVVQALFCRNDDCKCEPVPEELGSLLCGKNDLLKPAR